MRRLLRGRPTAWRAPLVAAGLIAAAAHVPVTAEHLDEAFYIGALFIALEAACMALALVLIWRPVRLAAGAMSLVGGLAVAAFVWSRAVGLPLIEDDIGAWTEPLAVVSVAAESVMAVGGALAALRPARPLTRPAAVLGAVGATALLIAGLPATVIAARAEQSDGGDGMVAMGAPARATTGHWGQVAGTSVRSGRIRVVRIAAEQVDLKTLTGGSGTACVYRQYADSDFRHRVGRTVDERYLGVLGPVLHAAVGDTLRVTLLNRCAFPVSLHPFGLRTGKNDEGAAYTDVTQGSQKRDDAVAPGRRFAYTWSVPERSGPGAGDGSSIAWRYSTGVGGGARTAALSGLVIVTRAGGARADGTPADVDREIVLDVGQRTVNGYRTAVLPPPASRVGQRVRWYLLDSSAAVSSVEWYGDTLLAHGHRLSRIDLAPGDATTADMVPDDFGWWMLRTSDGRGRYVVVP